MAIRNIAVASVLCAAAACATAGELTFEGLPIGSVGGPLVLSDDGVTVTISSFGLTVRDFNISPFPHSTLIHPGDFTSAMTLEFTPGVREVSFENYIYGFYTGEVDLFKVQAFDASNNLVDSFSGGGQYIGVAAGPGEGDIARVVIDDVMINDQETGYQVDNIRFDDVPAPAASLLALAPLAMARRRR